MRIGASTSNFYPAPTEQALDTLLDAGFRTVEVFLNTASEAAPAFAKQLRERADEVNAEIVAVHPHSSFTEPFCLFSRYERRFYDALEAYRVQFEAAAVMGAKFLILHGDKATNPALSAAEFADRYAQLFEVGKACGVTLLQENVVNYRAESTEFVREMRRLLGDMAQFVLDLKQCRRAGVSVFDMMDAMGDGLRHVHLSDGDDTRDCKLPGDGQEDFAALFSRLCERGYTGDAMIELYSRDFGDVRDLLRGREYLLAAL